MGLQPLRESNSARGEVVAARVAGGLADVGNASRTKFRGDIVMVQNISSDNLSTVRAFFSALEHHDKSALGPLLAADVVEIVPLSRTGSAEPEAEFRGREAVLGYLATIIDNFTQTVLADKQFYEDYAKLSLKKYSPIAARNDDVKVLSGLR